MVSGKAWRFTSSHSPKATTDASLGTVGAKLARERPVQTALTHGVSSNDIPPF